MSNWILNESSVQKVQALQKAYKKNRITAASNTLNIDISNFHPIFGDIELCKKIDEKTLQTLMSANRYFDISYGVQNARQTAYSKADYLETFSNKSYGVEIDLNVEKEHPKTITELREALELIKAACPWMYKNFESVIYEFCFIKIHGNRRGAGGASDYHLIGTIVIGLCDGNHPVLELAISIAHEVAHNVFHLYQAGQRPIHNSNNNELVYSAIRKTDRPVYGSLHAIIALSYMLSLCDSITSKSDIFDNKLCKEAKLKKDEYLEALCIGLDAIQSIKFNPIGSMVIEEITNLKKSIEHKLVT